MLDIFYRGGPVMYPLALCSIVALTIVIERFANLRSRRSVPPAVADTVDGLVESGVFDKARLICDNNPSSYTALMRVVIDNRRLSREELKDVLTEESKHELPQLTRYLPTLSTITSISPLLGLLGTVLGMIKMFDVIAQMGTGTAAALSSGIGQALITTVTGLSIAIPSLVFYNYFSNKAESIIADIEKRLLRVVRALTSAPSRPGSEGHGTASDATELSAGDFSYGE